MIERRKNGMCRNGHSMEDSYLRKTGERDCNTCRRESQKRFREKRKARKKAYTEAIELVWKQFEDERIGDLL